MSPETNTKQNFRAYRIHADDSGVRAGLETLHLDDLTDGDVVIRTHYSSVNYKDALAATGRGRILRRPVLNGGIDAAGVVVSSQSEAFREGDKVVVTGCGLSETLDGGYAEYLRVPADCVSALPASLTLAEAMIIGTAGFTAALAIHRMEENHLHPSMGPVAVTGANGGVGQMAIDLLASRGYRVCAYTSRPEHGGALEALGAGMVRDVAELSADEGPLARAEWGGAIDALGGDPLSSLVRHTVPFGSVASIGLAASHTLDLTVMPFILRGVSLLGISSANCPCALRREIWRRLGDDLRPRHLGAMHSRTVTLDELDTVFDGLLARELTGRVLVDIAGDADPDAR